MDKDRKKFFKKQPIQGRSKATVEAILEAATYILVNDGLENFNTNHVAEKAGVSIASLYQYFVDKNAILCELKRRHVEKTRANAEKIGKHYKENKLEDLVIRLIENGIAAHTTDPDLHRIFGRISTDTQMDETPSSDTLHLSGLKAALESHGMQSDDAEFTVWLFRTIVHATIHEGVYSHHDDIVSGRLAAMLNKILVSWLEEEIGSQTRKHIKCIDDDL